MNADYVRRSQEKGMKNYADLVAQLHGIRKILAVKAVLISFCCVVVGCNAPSVVASSMTALLWIGCEAFNECAVKRLSDKLDQLQQSESQQSNRKA
jgi:hypothetical protein